jgi:hypothetical protein
VYDTLDCVASLVVSVSVSVELVSASGGGLHVIEIDATVGWTRSLIGMPDTIVNQLDVNVVATFSLPYATLLTLMYCGDDVPISTDPNEIVDDADGFDANVGPVAVHVIVYVALGRLASLVDNTRLSVCVPDAPDGGEHWTTTIDADAPLTTPAIGRPDTVDSHPDVHVDVWLTANKPAPVLEIEMLVVCADVIEPKLIVDPALGVDE